MFCFILSSYGKNKREEARIFTTKQFNVQKKMFYVMLS